MDHDALRTAAIDALAAAEAAPDGPAFEAAVEPAQIAMNAWRGTTWPADPEGWAEAYARLDAIETRHLGPLA